MHRHFGQWAQRYGVNLSPAGDGGGGGGADDNVQLTDDLRASDPDKYYRLYWKKESGAAQAFTTRDETKRRIKELEGKVMSDDERTEYQTLKSEKATIEDQRKRAEGKFDELKTELHTKHTTALGERDTRIKDLEDQIADREIGLAFANAIHDKAPLFGGDDALTIFPPDMAAKALRDLVVVEHVEINGRKVPTVHVKNPTTGKTILGSDGNPAPFAQAMVEAINLLPSKDRILRGSGKTGSGSHGGSNTRNGDLDLDRVTAADIRRNPELAAQLRARQSGYGNVEMGAGIRRG